MAITQFEIERDLNSLDYSWYQSKLAFFKQEKGDDCKYDSQKDQIILKYNTRDEIFTDKDDNDHGETIFDTKEISFLQYCFNSNFDGSLCQNNETFDEWGPTDIHELPIDIEPIRKDILNYADQELEGILELQFRYNILSKILNKIRELLSNREYEDEKYIRLKSEIQLNLEKAIKSKHGNIISKFEEFTALAEEKKRLAKKESDKKRYIANKIEPGSLKKVELSYSKEDIKELEIRIKSYFGPDKRNFEIKTGSLYVFFNQLCTHSETFTPFVITIKHISNFYYLISRINKHIERFDYGILNDAEGILVNKRRFNKDYIDDYPTRADNAFKDIIDTWIATLKK